MTNRLKQIYPGVTNIQNLLYIAYFMASDSYPIHQGLNLWKSNGIVFELGSVKNIFGKHTLCQE